MSPSCIRFSASSLLLSLLVLSSLLVSGCAPTPNGLGEPSREPELADEHFIAADGRELPMRSWLPAIEPRAVVVALHGFNDYSRAFEEAGGYWAENYQIATYAYDQRGFGYNEDAGEWAGSEAYVRDLRDFCAALRVRYPGQPVYVLGSSMGGAIATVAFASERPPAADGVILAAPAVWARETMPWYQRMALFIGAHTIPWASFTGEGLGVVPSDNRDMLMDLGRDPKVIKDTQVAAIYGLTNLMDEALGSVANLSAPALIMIGELDEVVPNHASATMLERLPALEVFTTAVYDQGYHMLLRDLQRQAVWDDVASWIKSPVRPLPSGASANDMQAWISHNK